MINCHDLIPVGVGHDLVVDRLHVHWLGDNVVVVGVGFS